MFVHSDGPVDVVFVLYRPYDLILHRAIGNGRVENGSRQRSRQRHFFVLILYSAGDLVAILPKSPLLF